MELIFPHNVLTLHRAYRLNTDSACLLLTILDRILKHCQLQTPTAQLLLPSPVSFLHDASELVQWLFPWQNSFYPLSKRGVGSLIHMQAHRHFQEKWNCQLQLIILQVKDIAEYRMLLYFNYKMYLVGFKMYYFELLSVKWLSNLLMASARTV